MDKKQQALQTFWILVALFGGLAMLTGLLGIVLGFVFPPSEMSLVTVVVVAMGLIALLFGFALVLAGLTGWKQVPSRRFYSRWGWLIFLLLAAGLIGVAVFIPADRQNTPLFAPLHLGMIVLPALFLLSLITLTAGREAALTFRQMIVTMTGGVMTIFLALPVELFGFLFSAVMVIAVAIVVPGGEAEVTRLTNLAQQWAATPPADMESALSVIASPVVLAILALTLAVVAPLIEEFGKTLVMGVMGFWEHPGLTRAFVWGAACGLGFAMVEGISNGATGLGEMGGWLGGVGSRVLATAMHALTSGLIGLGWGFFWRKRRWALPLAYAVSVIFHGLWNFNVVLMAGGTGLGTTSSPIGYVLLAAGMGMQGLLLLVTPAALIGIPFFLRRREARSDATA